MYIIIIIISHAETLFRKPGILKIKDQFEYETYTFY